MRTALALGLVILAAACAAPGEPTSAASSADIVVPAPSLPDSIKAAYEAAKGKSILEAAKDADWQSLTGDAREAYNEYANTSSWGLIAMVGGPIAQKGTFDGVTVYFIAGDLSDTGSEYGFYDETGKALAVAYAGQGEHPGPGGVDWEK